MHALLSVLPVYTTDVSDDLRGSKILKTGDMRPTTVY